MSTPVFSAKDFGKNFQWGVVMVQLKTRVPLICMVRVLQYRMIFSRRVGKVKGSGTPGVSCDFYHSYKDDLLLAKAFGFTVFRFSISWPRILHDGIGKIIKEELNFYQLVIDECIKLGLIPHITLYHWDLPYELQKKGGWVNYLVTKWFEHFVSVCAEAYDGRVKNWIILNEPFGFTTLGYML